MWDEIGSELIGYLCNIDEIQIDSIYEYIKLYKLCEFLCGFCRKILKYIRQKKIILIRQLQ